MPTASTLAHSMPSSASGSQKVCPLCSHTVSHSLSTIYSHHMSHWSSGAYSAHWSLQSSNNFAMYLLLLPLAGFMLLVLATVGDVDRQQCSTLCFICRLLRFLQGNEHKDPAEHTGSGSSHGCEREADSGCPAHTESQTSPSPSRCKGVIDSGKRKAMIICSTALHL